MTRQGRAERKVAEKVTGYHWNGRIRKSTVILPSIAAKLLNAEHARSVRIVKRAERMGLRAVLDTDTNEYLEGYQQATSDILAALQRGRGGKG